MNNKMDKSISKAFELQNMRRATKKATVIGLTTLMLATNVPQADAASRYDLSNYRGVGYISKVEEVGASGNGGFISSGIGDYGGVSYGIYQFSTTTGSAKQFVQWCKTNAPEVYKYFKDEGSTTPNTDGFNRAWKKAYKELGTKFEKTQYEFASEVLIEPAYKKVKSKYGIDLKSSRAREEYLISTSIQFGAGGICNLFNEVINNGTKLSDDMDDSELLSIMCDHKYNTVAQHFRSSSTEVQNAARNRFKREKKELLKIVAEESGEELDVAESTDIEITSEEFDDIIAVEDEDINNDYEEVKEELASVKNVITGEEEIIVAENNEEQIVEEKEDNTVKEDDSNPLDNQLFVGDSHFKGIEETIQSNYKGSIVEATVGASAYTYIHDTTVFGEALLNSLPNDSDDIKGIIVSLGINNITTASNKSDVLKVLDALQEKYPGKDIKFMLVNHVGEKYGSDYKDVNKLVDELNDSVKEYSKTHENVYTLNASIGLEKNGLLSKTYDGLHIYDSDTLLKNLEQAASEVTGEKETLDEITSEDNEDYDEFNSIIDEDTTSKIEDNEEKVIEDKDVNEEQQEDVVNDNTEEEQTQKNQSTNEEDNNKEDVIDIKDNEVETEDKNIKEEVIEENDNEDVNEEQSDSDNNTIIEEEQTQEIQSTEDNTIEETDDKNQDKIDELQSRLKDNLFGKIFMG